MNTLTNFNPILVKNQRNKSPANPIICILLHIVPGIPVFQDQKGVKNGERQASGSYNLINRF